MNVEMILSNAAAELVAEYRTWVEAEWGTVDSFVGSADMPLPAPVLALAEGRLVGGLSFTHSCVPDTHDTVLWINTLLVAPAFRRRGIGSELVKAAERSVALAGIDELYVFTGFAQLYQQLGWRIHGHAGESSVLRKQLAA